MEEALIDRLAITIVDGSQARGLIHTLAAQGVKVTVIDAVGGFLHDALVTLLVGTSEANLGRFFATVRRCCPQRTRYVSMGVEMSMTPGYPLMIEAHVGGASVFVVPVESFIQL